MSVFQCPIGATLPIPITVRRSGAPVSLTGWHLMVKVMANLTDPDDACVSLLDNLELGGVTLSAQAGSTLGQATGVMPPSATLSMPNVQTSVHYEVWSRDTAGNITREDNGTITLMPRGLVQQP